MQSELFLKIVFWLVDIPVKGTTISQEASVVQENPVTSSGFLLGLTI